MWLTPWSSSRPSSRSARSWLIADSAAAPKMMRLLSWPVRPNGATGIIMRLLTVGGGRLSFRLCPRGRARSNAFSRYFRRDRVERRVQDRGGGPVGRDRRRALLALVRRRVARGGLHCRLHRGPDPGHALVQPAPTRGLIGSTVASVEPALHPDVEALACLLGRWSGEGEGHYPTIEPFAYREEITLGHSGKPFLAYRQATVRVDTGMPAHAEMGYLRGVGPGQVELVIAHPTGVAEVAERSEEHRAELQSLRQLVWRL